MLTAMFQIIQNEIEQWAGRNFPDTPIHRPVLGMVEELGELIDADLKGSEVECKDAVGDFAVYAMHYCVLRNWRYDEVIDKHAKPDARDIAPWFMILKEGGELCHSQLKWEQNIRGTAESHEQAAKTALANLTFAVNRYCNMRRWKFEDIVKMTWETVKKRDWQKHQKDGVSA